MAYEMQNWQPRLGVGLNKFTDAVSGNTLELTNTPDSISQEGTPFSADRMNHIEVGIAGAAATADEAYSLNPSLIQLQSSIDLNTVITPGQYHGEGNPNIPSGASGQYYLVVETVGSFTLQHINFYLDIRASGGTYTREGEAGGTAWGSWYHDPNEASITANFYSITGNATDIAASTDLDDVTEPGQYRGNNNSSGPGGSGQFYLVVEVHDSSIRQTIDYGNGGQMYSRWGAEQPGGVYWLSWRRMTNPEAAYVTGRGTNAGWDYRMWSDGKIEFWGVFTVQGAHTEIQTNVAYPWTLTGAPMVWAQGQAYCWDLSRPIYVAPSINKTIGVYLYPRSSESRRYGFYIYASGTLA